MKRSRENSKVVRPAALSSATTDRMDWIVRWARVIFVMNFLRSWWAFQKRFICSTARSQRARTSTRIAVRVRGSMVMRLCWWCGGMLWWLGGM